MQVPSQSEQSVAQTTQFSCIYSANITYIYTQLRNVTDMHFITETNNINRFVLLFMIIIPFQPGAWSAQD